MTNFSLTSRVAGESKSQYGTRFSNKLEELMERYPSAVQEPFLDGIRLVLNGTEVAYLSTRGK
jgi:hypothetical protein